VNVQCGWWYLFTVNTK